ncbi:MAG TPA: hypothetical protein VEP90_01865 [Methylomirabilota bacterium]|nr:hypothetical protein [Methylomirabilota bacterium]
MMSTIIGIIALGLFFVHTCIGMFLGAEGETMHRIIQLAALNLIAAAIAFHS